MKTDLFQSCGHCWVFQICWNIECTTFTASSFRIWNCSTGIPSPPPALSVVLLPKANLISHSRMSGSRWVITPSWLSRYFRSFWCSSSVYSCHLFYYFFNVRTLHLFIYLFIFKFIYFNWRLITLQYWSGFCQTLKWISHGCTCVPHPELPSHLPPHPIPQGHHGAPALSTLSHASNLDWRSVSHMIIYMFQCYFLKSSHPRLFPHSPKDWSIHLCLFCCLTYRVIVTIFLNSIYMC